MVLNEIIEQAGRQSRASEQNGTPFTKINYFGVFNVDIRCQNKSIKT